MCLASLFWLKEWFSEEKSLFRALIHSSDFIFCVIKGTHTRTVYIYWLNLQWLWQWKRHALKRTAWIKYGIFMTYKRQNLVWNYVTNIFSCTWTGMIVDTPSGHKRNIFVSHRQWRICILSVIQQFMYTFFILAKQDKGVRWVQHFGNELDCSRRDVKSDILRPVSVGPWSCVASSRRGQGGDEGMMNGSSRKCASSNRRGCLHLKANFLQPSGGKQQRAAGEVRGDECNQDSVRGNKTSLHDGDKRDGWKGDMSQSADT